MTNEQITTAFLTTIRTEPRSCDLEILHELAGRIEGSPDEPTAAAAPASNS